MMDVSSKDWLKFALELYEKTKDMGLNQNWGKKELESLIDSVSKLKYTYPGSPPMEKSESMKQEAGFAPPEKNGDDVFWQQGSKPPGGGLSSLGVSKDSRHSPISIYESGKEVNIHVILPGITSRENLSLLLSAESLELSGARATGGFSGAGQGNETFYRMVRLPAPVEPAGTTATYRNGFLYIRAPKKAHPAPLKVEVRFE